jgi:transcriptional antiterminator RfaH
LAVDRLLQSRHSTGERRNGSERSDVPLLKREPEIWPPSLFGEPGGEAPALAEVRASASIHRRAPAASEGGAPASAWWVARTRSRQEKHLARHLLQWEVPYYLPQREHRFRVSERWRTSYLPLFTSYVFFHGDHHDRVVALKSNRIVHLIPAPDPAELGVQLRSLWLLQMAGTPLVSHPYLAPGDEVEITQGSLRGYHGVVLREKGKYRLVVSITLLKQSVATEIDRDALAPSAMRRVGRRTTMTARPSPAADPRNPRP